MVRAVLLALLLAGCTTARGTFCDIAKPIRLSDATIDAMTDQEVAAALAHNRKGAALCGWKPIT
jgi:Zn-dependent protease with chaperone function